MVGGHVKVHRRYDLKVSRYRSTHAGSIMHFSYQGSPLNHKAIILVGSIPPSMVLMSAMRDVLLATESHYMIS